jgi:hypothetical protein
VLFLIKNIPFRALLLKNRTPFLATALYFLLVLAWLGFNWGPFWLFIVVSCLHLSLRSSYMHSYLFVYSVLKHCAHTSCCLHVIAFALLMYHYVHRVCTCHYVPRTCTRITVLVCPSSIVLVTLFLVHVLVCLCTR